MKYYDWSDKKNKFLIKERGVSFEEIVLAIEGGRLVDTIKNSARYANQMVFCIQIKNYIYAVPFIEEDKKLFLKTIIPNRKLTKKYLKINSKK